VGNGVDFLHLPAPCRSHFLPMIPFLPLVSVTIRVCTECATHFHGQYLLPVSTFVCKPRCLQFLIGNVSCGAAIRHMHSGARHMKKSATTGHTNTHTHTHTHTRKHTHTYARTHARTHTHKNTHTHTVHTYTHVHTHTHKHTHTHARTHARTHTQTRIHTCIHTPYRNRTVFYIYMV